MNWRTVTSLLGPPTCGARIPMVGAESASYVFPSTRRADLDYCGWLHLPGGRRVSTSILRAAVFVLLFGISAPAFAAAPTATTSAATGITTSSAMLNGAGTPNGTPTTGWFRYSTTNPVTCNSTFGTRVPTSDGTDLGTGSSAIRYSITTTGLSPGNTYYFCAIVSNTAGTAFGAVLSFTIPGAPVVVTSAATSVTSSSAIWRGAGRCGPPT